MREIRYIYIIIGIALCLQSCHRESHPNNPDADAYAISMVPTSVQGASRALINGIDDLQDLGFVVYGHSTASSDKQQVFAGDKVTFDNGEWGYTDTQYWNAAATYCFGAYAPKMAGVTETETDDIITSLSIPLPQWQQVDGSETDLIVATSQDAAERYLAGGGTVNLAFNHVYAQVEIQVVKGEALVNSYRLKSLTLSGVPSTDGTATYTLDFTTTTPAQSAWSGITEGTYTVFTGTATIGTTADATTTFTRLVVPFEGTANIGLTYTAGAGDIDDASYPKDIDVDLDLVAGEKTVLTLTINSANEVDPQLHIAQWEHEEIEEDYKTNW